MRNHSHPESDGHYYCEDCGEAVIASPCPLCHGTKVEWIQHETNYRRAYPKNVIEKSEARSQNSESEHLPSAICDLHPKSPDDWFAAMRDLVDAAPDPKPLCK